MEFIGKLHPLIVHLPIGILLMGLFLFWYGQFRKVQIYLPVLSMIFLIGAITVLLAGATGWLLSTQDDYDEGTVNRHRNTGIILAIAAWDFWLRLRKKSATWTLNILSISLLIILLITGHYGGTLTHGSSYLFAQKEQKANIFFDTAAIQSAQVYADIIQPILTEKCTSCHGPEKQKGGLRLDELAFILKGGKHGSVLGKGSEKSILLTRLLLPPDDDEHMPPKEKGQLSRHQITLIQWWIRNGAIDKTNVSDWSQDDKVREALASLTGGSVDDIQSKQEVYTSIPLADPQLIEQLRKAGAMVVPVSMESGALNVSLLNLTDSSNRFWEILVKLSPQVVSLRAEHASINNGVLPYIAQLTELQKLSLKGTKIQDEGIENLTRLTRLRSLNLSGTGVSGKGISVIKGMNELLYLYLQGCQLTAKEMEDIRSKMPNCTIYGVRDTLPFYSSDTAMVR